MLDVWSVCTGHKYNPGYVYALRDAVATHLNEPHHFRVLTDCPHHFPGIDWVYLQNDFGGWWNKITIFDLSAGPSLYFDLDVVIVDELDFLIQYTDYDFAAPANWAASGHGGIQSSVMAWSGNMQPAFRAFADDPDNYRGRLWGDQEFLTEWYEADWARIPRICSYKYHCRGHASPPANAAVVVFHGKPDPHEVTDEWILQYTSTLRSRIKSNTANGSRVVSSATV